MREILVVADWDNTLYHGYTMNRWMQYLVPLGLFSEDMSIRIQALADRYDRGELTHDAMATIAGDEFARGIAGRGRRKILVSCAGNSLDICG